MALVMEVDLPVKYENSRCFINDLPDEVIEYILRLLPPYQDLEQCMLVCKRWQRNVLSVIRQKKYSFDRSIASFTIKCQHVHSSSEGNGMISRRYSHSACNHGNSMYVFGGCTSTSTTFNDLWRLDLSTRKWLRQLTTGNYPTPKACATIVCYNDSLILFGGWTPPLPYPMHQPRRVFNELHIYNIKNSKWTCITTPTLSPPPMAAHSATIHGHTMVVFGGHHDNLGSTNDVWCFDVLKETWRKQPISNPKPSPRYGQSQIALDLNHLIIIGGCGGGPYMELNDVWLLDMSKEKWLWKTITVQNPQWAASKIWSHPACKVGNNIVVFSRNPKSAIPNLSYSKCQGNCCQVVPNCFGMKDTSPEQQSVDRDINVNGRRGSLVPRSVTNKNQPCFSAKNLSRSSQNIEIQGPSDQLELSKSLISKEVNEVSLNNTNKRHLQAEGSSNSKDRISQHLETSRAKQEVKINSNYNEGSLAAFRESATTNPAVRQREKQLEALRRMEEKISRNKNNQQVKKEQSLSYIKKSVTPKMVMFVMDISNILTDYTVSWLPFKSINDGSPDDKMLYTLVVGNGELIMFGGIQRDASSANQETNHSLNTTTTVSNSLHFITAPCDII